MGAREDCSHLFQPRDPRWAVIHIEDRLEKLGLWDLIGPEDLLQRVPGAVGGGEEEQHVSIKRAC